MIRALITGELYADPQSRTSKNGNAFALARVTVPQGDEGRIFCRVIAFDDAAVVRMLQLKAGVAVSLAGTLKVGTWQAKDGTTRPSLDLQADEVASTTPRPRKAKEAPTARFDEFGAARTVRRPTRLRRYRLDRSVLIIRPASAEIRAQWGLAGKVDHPMRRQEART